MRIYEKESVVLEIKRVRVQPSYEERMSLLTKAIVELGKCQVRSGTAQPCQQPAVLKIQGIPFCESCAREQEAYFAIGEFTEAKERAGGKSLAVVMDLMRQIRLREQMVRDHEPDAA